MKVLFLSRSSTGKPHAFVKEQADVLKKQYRFDIDHLLIESGGIKGFIKAVFNLNRYLKNNPVHIVHVHYGLWTMIALINKWLFFRKFKVVVTYHGSDVFKSKERPVSLLASRFVAKNILVTDRMIRFFSANSSVIPCGIDIDITTGFRHSDRNLHHWGENDFIVLFSSSFDRPVKDPEFAFEVIKALRKVCNKRVHFIELKGYNRQQLTSLMQAADVLLMCSKSEGSPQVIKEAILNLLPVVSNNVGDVAAICEGIDNTYIVEKSVDHFVMALNHLAVQGFRISDAAPLVQKFDNKIIAGQVYSVYTSVLKNNELPVPLFS